MLYSTSWLCPCLLWAPKDRTAFRDELRCQDYWRSKSQRSLDVSDATRIDIGSLCHSDFEDPASAIALDNNEDMRLECKKLATSELRKHGGDGVDMKQLELELAKEMAAVKAASEVGLRHVIDSP